MITCEYNGRKANVRTLQGCIRKLEEDIEDNLNSIESLKRQMACVDGNQPDLFN